MTRMPYYIRAVIDAHTLPKPEIAEHIAHEVEQDGLIARASNNEWATTSRGAAYVEALGRVPLPIQKWVIPD